MAEKEGFIQTPGGKVWYQAIGPSRSIPLVTVHGGPGHPHDSLEPLEDLSTHRQIIFYDQLGCGNSQRPKDNNFYSLNHYIYELSELIKQLGLKQYHLLGHSWGAGLSASFALTKPKGLKSLILSNPYLATPNWENDAKRLIKKLPQNQQIALKSGNIDSKEYQEAADKYYHKELWKTKDLPVSILKAEHKFNIDIYNHLWGPNEFKATGELKDFDLSGRLHEFKIPVLYICGRLDEATPESTEYFQSLTPNSRLLIFAKSAHMPHWTERKKYIQEINNFLLGIS
jgi:proline iminopeptidase